MASASTSREEQEPGTGGDTGQDQQQQDDNSKKRRGSSNSGPAAIKSFVHDEFEQTRTGKGKTLKWTSRCKHCSMELKNRDKRGLLTHLRAHHKEIHDKVTLLDDKNNEQRKEDEDQPQTKEDRLKELFLRFLIATGNRMDLGEKKEFQDLISEINSTIKLPGGRAMKKFCRQQFKKMKKDMMEVLERSDRLSVTSDLWSSFNCMLAFLGLTVHGYDPKRKKRFNFRLALRVFDFSETGENLLSEAKRILSEFNILEKISNMLTDNGSNIKKSMRLLKQEQNLELGVEIEVEDEDDDEEAGMEIPLEADEDEYGQVIVPGGEEDVEEDQFFPAGSQEKDVKKMIQQLETYFQEVMSGKRRFSFRRLACLCHSLQLVVLNVLHKTDNIFNELLKKVRAIVGRIVKSTKAKRLLKQEVGLVIMSSCPTRWWSELRAIRRVVRIEEKSPGVLSKIVKKLKWKSKKFSNLSLTAKDIKTLTIFIEIFKEFEAKSDMWGGEQFSTLCGVIPMVRDLLEHLDRSVVIW